MMPQTTRVAIACIIFAAIPYVKDKWMAKSLPQLNETFNPRNREEKDIEMANKLRYHYENTPMQYTAIFHGCKNVHFQMKIFNIFLIFAQNIDCGYTLEPPQ